MIDFNRRFQMKIFYFLILDHRFTFVQKRVNERQSEIALDTLVTFEIRYPSIFSIEL